MKADALVGRAVERRRGETAPRGEMSGRAPSGWTPRNVILAVTGLGLGSAMLWGWGAFYGPRRPEMLLGPKAGRPTRDFGGDPAPAPQSNNLCPPPRAVSHLDCLEDAATPSCPPVWESNHCPPNTVALCLFVDRPFDAPRWIDWHLDVGVQRFYIYDFNSSLPMVDRVPELADLPVVRYEYFNTWWGRRGPQLAAYGDCIDRFADRHQWLGFIGPDDYLTPLRDGGALLEQLSVYNDFGGLALAWRPADADACTPADGAACSLVHVMANVRYLVGVGDDPHTFRYREGRTTVTEELHRVEEAHSQRLSSNTFVIRRQASFPADVG